ncbi:MAG: hypothetical protein IKP40_07045 [Clostridia bacterium]|nr:hypothetical protein [Clostridia bacterium]
MISAPEYVKEYVEVHVDFSPDGTMLPRTLVWEDGRQYEIDRIKAIQAAPALKAGGQGDRYTVMIAGRERFLFFEHNADFGNERIGKWFVERRVR